MNWWLWSAWIEEPNGTRRPFYAFLVKTKALVSSTQYQRVTLPSKDILVVAQRVVTASEAATLLELVVARRATIELKAFFAEAPAIELMAYRQIVCEAFGHSAAHADCGYALSTPEELLPWSEDTETLLKHCTSQLGLKFRSTHALHLGGFDVFHLDSWLDDPNPFGSSVVKGIEGDTPNLVRIWRNDLSDQRHIVHLRAMADGEILHEGAHFLNGSAQYIDVKVEGVIDAYELSLFDATQGTLRYKESTTMMMEAAFSMRTSARTVVHRDRLQAKAASRGGALRDRAASTTATHTLRSSVNFDPAGLRSHRIAMNTRLNEHMPSLSQDRWFPRTFELGLGVIDHLNRLLDAGQIREAVLVDPYFGEDALQTVATRFNQADVRLTIVASWGKTDPDTGARIEGSVASARSFAQRRLTPVFKIIGPLLGIQLQFVNVIDSDGSQAFHDRYLLLNPHEGPADVYLLSNSLNNMATKWPFCLSLLGGMAGIHAKRYIEGLVQGHDVTASTNPQINFQWASPGFSTHRA